MQVDSDREYRFDRTPQEVWDAIAQVDSYPQWWPWLRRFDAAGLAVGERWRCTISPPVPYVLRLVLTIVEAHPPVRIDATVTGDIRGEASVELFGDGDGCRVRLRSSLAPARQPLRSVAALAPWLARRGHDWVLDTGSRQFRRRALRT